MTWASSLARLNSYDAIVAEDILYNIAPRESVVIDLLIVTRDDGLAPRIAGDVETFLNFDASILRAKNRSEFSRILGRTYFDVIIFDNTWDKAEVRSMLRRIEAEPSKPVPVVMSDALAELPEVSDLVARGTRVLNKANLQQSLMDLIFTVATEKIAPAPAANNRRLDS